MLKLRINKKTKEIPYIPVHIFISLCKVVKLEANGYF